MGQGERHFTEQHLWVSGTGGYVRYRIPAILVSAAGTILAFCEARKFTGQDTDQIDLLLRRSEDGGQTFGESILVTTEHDWVSGNPAPVQDRSTGRIWLPFCRNRIDGDERAISAGQAPRTVWMLYSDDDGRTWSDPVEITAAVKRPEWGWYATGPCHAIQLASGRLVIPCNHRLLPGYGDEADHAHVIYSDDHGATWLIGGIADAGTNESSVLEAADGALYLNSRNHGLEHDAVGYDYRAVAWSLDGGITFAPVVHDASLPEPRCQASVCRLTGGSGADGAAAGRSRVLFSNPTGVEDGERVRSELTVRLSYDECRTWPVARTLHAGPAAYSDLCVTGDGTICCLYERGDRELYETLTLTLARFNLAWLTDGIDSGDCGDLSGRAIPAAAGAAPASPVIRTPAEE